MPLPLHPFTVSNYDVHREAGQRIVTGAQTLSHNGDAFDIAYFKFRGQMKPIKSNLLTQYWTTSASMIA
jgi:hypothetical protein